MVLKPGSEAKAEAIFKKWDLDFAVIGRITDSGHLVLRHQGEVVADIPLGPLADDAPVYERPWEPTPPAAKLRAADVPAPASLGGALTTLLGTPDLCSKRWIWEQYDHMVMADTVIRPGGDAALVRVHGTNKGLAVTTDCTPRYCEADPRAGGAQAVAETWRNITATGATPLAITDCMNFGNPQRPRIMGQFAAAIEGMAEACRALDYPVVSGNVSLYNETNGKGVQPTPAIGGVGLIADIDQRATIDLKGDGNTLVLIGKTKGHLGSSLYLREIAGREEGAPPPVDLAAERRSGDFVRQAILQGKIKACHDVADGGLLVAVAEMALAGKRGVTLNAAPAGIPAHAYFFGEDQARYVLEIAPADLPALEAAAKAAGVPFAIIGETGGQALTIGSERPISLGELRRVHESWLPSYMGAA